ncbi:unnamed protein product [Porites evermanni]|uniref:Uncharacterized protein n=1 Tax=Porites evermanni TaxID=104178 RepID=A0ABN8LHN9_9CNID|nr:unnamed protein product [Porites evermanni]
MLHSPLLQFSCRFCTCRHIYMPWSSKEIVERIRLLGSAHSMLTVNTPLTLLLASLTLASEGLHCNTIRCLQALGEKDMVPALYSIRWSDSFPALSTSSSPRRTGFCELVCNAFVLMYLQTSISLDKAALGVPKGGQERPYHDTKC